LLFFAGFALEPVGLLLFSIGFLVFFGAYFLLTPFQMIHLTMIFHKLTESNTQMLALTSNRKVHIFDRMISSKKILINGFIVTVVGMSLFTWVMINEVDNTRYAVDITAHRGSSKEAPENTLASLDTAILHGASYAEIDVQETKGGGVVLTHDESLERVTGLDKMVWQVGLEEIQALDAGAWFDSKFIGEKMPTLEEAMDYSKGRLKLNIEIKVHGHERLIIGQVVKLIQEKNYYKECVVTSLDYDVLQEIERLDSKIKTGYVMAIALGNLEQLNVDFYSVEESNVTESFVSNAHLIGREVHVWTINSKASMEKMLDLGVDNIITDNDRMLSDLIRTLNAM